MSYVHIRACGEHSNRTASSESAEKRSGRRSRGRCSMGSGGCDRNSVPQMRSSKGILLSDADSVGRRADDHILPLRKLWSPMERKLGALTSVCIFFIIFPALSMIFENAAVRPKHVYSFASAHQVESQPFKIVLFTCVWKRPVLTDFVLNHYNSMKPILLSQHNVHLDIFITGSDNSTTHDVARRVNAGFAVHPNRPLGSKHNLGLRSLMMHFLRQTDNAPLPNAVAIVGSDDILNLKFFANAKSLMTRPIDRMHIVGLRDIFFFDLESQQLMYTAGYRQFSTPISGTVGCGRVFSWEMLDTLEWELWDWERDRSLDQSSIRRVLKLVPQIAEVSVSIPGIEHGIVAIDVKTDAFEQGTNIWRFKEVVKAVGKNGLLHDYQERNAPSVMDNAFGQGFYKDHVLPLRAKMKQLESKAPT